MRGGTGREKERGSTSQHRPRGCKGDEVAGILLGRRQLHGPRTPCNPQARPPTGPPCPPTGPPCPPKHTHTHTHSAHPARHHPVALRAVQVGVASHRLLARTPPKAVGDVVGVQPAARVDVLQLDQAAARDLGREHQDMCSHHAMSDHGMHARPACTLPRTGMAGLPARQAGTTTASTSSDRSILRRLGPASPITYQDAALAHCISALLEPRLQSWR